MVYSFSNMESSKNLTFNNGITNATTLAREDLLIIGTSSLICIPVYTIIFITSLVGSIYFLNVLRKQNKRTGSRITLLLFHLSLADLMVCGMIIPADVYWRLSGQWTGTPTLCKLSMYFRAFGLYLSSLVLICVSLDRFLAIVFPLSVRKVGAYKRTKMMLLGAWVSAALSAIPMTTIFGLETRLSYPSFKECTFKNFYSKYRNAQVYSIFSVVLTYFLPLFVIIFSYTCIIFKLIQRSRARKSQGAVIVFSRVERNNRVRGVVSIFKIDGKQSVTNLELRCSNNIDATLSRAKTKTLLMTVVITFGYICCWSPYAFMTLWFIHDSEKAEKVHPDIPDLLFMMAVANSCINPLIYHCFTFADNSRTQIMQKQKI